MTKLISSLSNIKSAVSSSLSEFSVEITRSPLGASVIVSGALGISELTETCVCILTHKARVGIYGSRLALSVFDGRIVEIIGKVEDIQLKYGKG